MTFDEYLEKANGASELTIQPSWGQGRTTFGGLSAALLLEKIQYYVGEERYLRSFNVNFCRPLLTDVPFRLDSQILSSGKSISQISGQAIQNDSVVTQMTACFGIERDSNIEVQTPSIDVIPESKGQRLQYIKGLTPEFAQHVELSYCRGGLLFSGTDENHLSGWMRFRQPSASFGDSHLVALIDAWPPVVLQKLSTPVPAATATWSLELVNPLSLFEESLTGDSWIYYDAEIKQAHHGFAHTVARVYQPNGELIALSRQLVAVYDKA